MPVQAVPIVAGSTTLDKLRLFMRDYYDKNPLLDDVEFSDAELQAAVDNAIDHSNIIGRPTSYSSGDFPSNYVLMLGATSHLFKSEAMRQLRNQSQFQDGNIQGVGMDEKSANYVQLSQMMLQEFTQHVTNIKITSNLPIRGSRSPLGRRYFRP